MRTGVAAYAASVKTSVQKMTARMRREFMAVRMVLVEGLKTEIMNPAGAIQLKSARLFRGCDARRRPFQRRLAAAAVETTPSGGATSSRRGRRGNGRRRGRRSHGLRLVA